MTPAELVEEELRHIKSESDPGDLRGLAFSGGGIRSASFCLGVAQALEEGLKDRGLESFEYLSTVSGGGYTGAALTWLRHQQETKAQGYENGEKVERTAEDWADSIRRRPNPPVIPGGSKFAALLERFSDFIRSRGNYLDPNKRLNDLSLVGVVLRTMVIHLTVYGGLAVVGLFLLRRQPPAWLGLPDHPHALFVLLLMGAAALLAALGVSSLLYALFTASRSPALSRYRMRTAFQQVLGVVLGWTIVMALIGSVPFVHDLLDQEVSQLWAKGVAGILGALIGGAQAVAQFFKAQAGREKGGWLTSDAGVWVSALAGVYGLLLLADWAASAVQWPQVAGLAVVVAAVGAVTNINMVTPHRMYRDRLMEAFLPDPAAMLQKTSVPARLADTAPLAAMCKDKAPLHLINANLILVDSANTLYRGRGGDNFVLSPVRCGGDAVGWAEAVGFLGAPEDKDPLTLATAMAISGAAVNGHSGSAGQGPMRNALVSMLMTMFGMQLGYWVGRHGCHKRHPNFFQPGFNSLFGIRFRARSAFLQLSDGGHFENLAIYELIRRRVRTIVVADAGADPQYQFGDLGNAVEKAFADFGAVVDFGNALPELVPVDADGNRDPRAGLAPRGWVKGSVSFSDGQGGTSFTADLYYIKATISGDLPASIIAYKAANPDFPHQSTSDQFFDEPQLEAYRRLGYELATPLAEQLNTVKPAKVGMEAVS